MSANVYQDRWYVDLQGLVKPYTTEKIIEALLDGRLQVIHRVSKDQKNWRAICNEEYFDSILADLIGHFNQEARKYEGVSDEKGASDPKGTADASTGFHNLDKISRSIEEQLHHAGRLQDINVRLNSLRSLVAQIKDKRKIVIDASQRPTKLEMHPDDQSEMRGHPSFLQNLLSSLTIKDRRKRRMVLVLFLFISLVAGAVHLYIEERERRGREEERALAEQALKAKALGEYDRAVALFSQVKSPTHLDAKTLIEMAEANLQVKNYESSMQILQNLEGKLGEAGAKAQVGFLKGLIAFKRQEPELAANYYEASLKEKPLYPALFNLAIINLKTKNHDQAEALLLKAIRFDDYEKGPGLLALFEAAWGLDQKQRELKLKLENGVRTPDWARLTKVKELIIQARAEANPYSEELLATQILISAISNDEGSFIDLSKKWTEFPFLELPPKPVRIELDLSRATWEQIFVWCLEVYNLKDLPPIKSLLLAQCAAKVRKPSEILPYARHAHSLDPQDPILRGYLAYVLYLNENLIEAQDLLKGIDYSASYVGQKTKEEICKKDPDPSCEKKPEIEPKILEGPKGPQPESE